MNKVIKQNEPKHECDLNIDQSEEYVYISQCDDLLKISKQGARQLIEVLKEWVGDDSKDQPDWGEAPNGFNWWAQDKDKNEYFFKDKPILNEHLKKWMSTSCKPVFSSRMTIRGNWRGSLRNRPVNL